jgi:hypothetical protein
MAPACQDKGGAKILYGKEARPKDERASDPGSLIIINRATRGER